MVGLLLSLSCAMCVRFTSEGGAKRNSDGQLVCNTLHGVVRQLGQRVQLLPGVGRCGNTFLWAAEQHDVTAYIQRALDSTCWHRGGHWQMERVGGVVLTALRSKSTVFLIAGESFISRDRRRISSTQAWLHAASAETALNVNLKRIFLLLLSWDFQCRMFTLYTTDDDCV